MTETEMKIRSEMRRYRIDGSADIRRVGNDYIVEGTSTKGYPVDISIKEGEGDEFIRLQVKYASQTS
jgi:hypothetical protein